MWPPRVAPALNRQNQFRGALLRQTALHHVSVPLGDAVKLINKISQNLHTENAVADGGATERSVGHAGRADESSGGFLRGGGSGPET